MPFKKKVVELKGDFVKLEQIIKLLQTEDMKNYSLQIFPDYTVCLRYGSKAKTKSIDKMLTYLKKTFRE